jgi:hypothetical protein
MKNSILFSSLQILCTANHSGTVYDTPHSLANCCTSLIFSRLAVSLCCFTLKCCLNMSFLSAWILALLVMYLFMALSAGLFLRGLEPVVLVLLALLWLRMLTRVCTSRSSLASSYSSSIVPATYEVEPSTATPWNIWSIWSKYSGHPHLHFFHFEWPCRICAYHM